MNLEHQAIVLPQRIGGANDRPKKLGGIERTQRTVRSVLKTGHEQAKVSNFVDRKLKRTNRAKFFAGR